MDLDKNIKVLVYVAHFFDQNGEFSGKSKFQEPSLRKYNTNLCIQEYHKLPFDVTVNVCGYDGKCLVPLDKDFKDVISDPRLLVYHLLSKLHLETNYDYFIVAEDDILINSSSIIESIRFTRNNIVKNIYHPHRFEIINNYKWNPIDIMLLPGLSGNHLKYENQKLSEYLNPHAGFVLLSRDQVFYALNRVDFKFTGMNFGGYMASAFYNYLKHFILYRDILPYRKNYVVHMDHIIFQPSWRNRLKRFFVYYLEKYFCEYGKIFKGYTP